MSTPRHVIATDEFIVNLKRFEGGMDGFVRTSVALENFLNTPRLAGDKYAAAIIPYCDRFFESLGMVARSKPPALASTRLAVTARDCEWLCWAMKQFSGFFPPIADEFLNSQANLTQTQLHLFKALSSYFGVYTSALRICGETTEKLIDLAYQPYFSIEEGVLAASQISQIAKDGQENRHKPIWSVSDIAKASDWKCNTDTALQHAKKMVERKLIVNQGIVLDSGKVGKWEFYETDAQKVLQSINSSKSKPWTKKPRTKK